jgi:hypothetical protein
MDRERGGVVDDGALRVVSVVEEQGARRGRRVAPTNSQESFEWKQTSLLEMLET